VRDLDEGGVQGLDVLLQPHLSLGLGQIGGGKGCVRIDRGGLEVLGRPCVIRHGEAVQEGVAHEGAAVTTTHVRDLRITMDMRGIVDGGLAIDGMNLFGNAWNKLVSGANKRVDKVSR
jgi:hypothetical protein